MPKKNGSSKALRAELTRLQQRQDRAARKVGAARAKLERRQHKLARCEAEVSAFELQFDDGMATPTRRHAAPEAPVNGL